MTIDQVMAAMSVHVGLYYVDYSSFHFVFSQYSFSQEHEEASALSAISLLVAMPRKLCFHAVM